MAPEENDIIETAEDVEAKELMEQWSKENDLTDGDTENDASGPLHYDEDLEKFRREIYAADDKLDQIVLGTSDFDKAVDDFEKMTGVRPVMVVSLNGLGTKSARVAFDECCFLELIGPDPKQTHRPLGDKLADIEPGKLVPLHYGVRNKSASAMKDEEFKELGFECDEVTMVAHDQGMPWKWDLIFLQGHDDGGLVPFYVNWGDSHHAAGRLPIVGHSAKVSVKAPAGHSVHKLVEDVAGITTEEGDSFVEFTFQNDKGTHTFSGSSLKGISFPQEGGLEVKGC